VFTARYEMSPYIKQTRLVYKGFICLKCKSVTELLMRGGGGGKKTGPPAPTKGVLC